MIDDIYEELMESAGQYALGVYGPAGIGKSTICRAVMERIDPAKATEVNMVGQFTKIGALTTILRTFGVEQPEYLDEQVEDLCSRYPGHTLYLDNMEDPLNDDAFKKWFISFVRSSDWNILYSSRQLLDSQRIKSFIIAPLDLSDAKKMFLTLWKDEIPDSGQQKLEELLKILNCHPLAIKLVVAQKWRFPTVGALLEAWRKNAAEDIKLEEDDGKHSSLITAFRMSFRAVAGNREALILWGVMSFLPSTLSRKLFEMIFSANLKVYEKAKDLLLKNSLINAMQLPLDDYGYSMLSPTKEMAFKFDDTNRKTAIELLRKAFTSVFTAGMQLDRSNRAYWHSLSLECLPSALAFLEKTLLDEGRNEELVWRIGNYFQFSAPASLELLRILLGDSQDDRRFSAFLNNRMGDLESRLGKIEDAQQHYKQAEQLFRDERANLGLANVLQSMGDLERRLGQIEAAQQHYKQAEELFRAERVNLGLANVLQSMGDLESRLGKIEAAQQHYKQAEQLYRDERANLGLANVLQSMGDLERQQGNHKSSIERYEKALRLYEGEREPAGKSYVLGELCRTYARMGDKSKALQWLEQTKTFGDQIPEYARPYVANCLQEALKLLGTDPSETESREGN